MEKPLVYTDLIKANIEKKIGELADKTIENLPDNLVELQSLGLNIQSLTKLLVSAIMRTFVEELYSGGAD